MSVDSAARARLTFVQSGFDATLPPPCDGRLGSLSGLAEPRRDFEAENWRPTWVEVQIEGAEATPNKTTSLYEDRRNN